MEKLSRKNKRNYLTKTDFYKRISKLKINHPDNISYRESMRKQGNEIHQKNIEENQQKLFESISEKEQKIIELLKSKNLSQQEIDYYMENWINVNFWPKPKNYIESQKILKKLNKKYKINL